MAVTNTSLLFETFENSVWGPGAATNLYVDTGEYMIFDPGEQTKYFGIDLWVIEAGFTAYLDVRFGLVAWANLGSSGSWDASYDIDVLVEHPAAILGGDMMWFDFSDYTINAAEIESLGFGPGEDGISAGLDMIIEVAAGVRDIYVDWPWPFGSDSFGGFELINIEEEISLITVSLKQPELTYKFFEGLELTGRLPQGADTEGESEGSGVVTGDGTSDTNFIELAADLDELLLTLLGYIPEPTTQAVVKVLGDTVFAEHSYDLHDYVGFVDEGKIELKFTMVDIEATAGLALTEVTELDIRRLDDPSKLDITVNLRSDNGTPLDPTDDKYVSGYLGDKLGMFAPFSAGSGDPGGVPVTGDAKITADFDIARAHFTHDIGLALTFGITIEILKGALEGDWVPSFLEVSFGPLEEINIPDEDEGDDPWEIGLGTLYSHDFEVDGKVFNGMRDTYSVFFVQPGVAPTGWDPDAPGAEGVIFDYFEASRLSLEALFDEYAPEGYEMEPDTATAFGDHDYADPSKYPLGPYDKPIFFGWNGTTDVRVWIPDDGSIVMAAPAPRAAPGAPVTFGNLEVKFGNDRPSFGEPPVTLRYNTDPGLLFDRMRVEYDNTFTWKTVAYTFNGKTLQSFGPTNAVGQDYGDLLLYLDGDFYDGGENRFGSWDTFVGNFFWQRVGEAVVWDLAHAIEMENDGDDSTYGGVTLFDNPDDPDNAPVTIRGIEALILRTSSGDDYIVGGVHSDVIFTAEGDDIVKLPYFLMRDGVAVVDTSDDWVMAGDGDDLITAQLGNIPDPLAQKTTDHISGGAGIDHLFVRAGVQGLRYNVHTYWQSAEYPSNTFGEDGLGADASHELLDDLLFFMQSAMKFDTNFDVTSRDAFALDRYVELINGSGLRGTIMVGDDVESVSVVVDANTSDQGQGDDLIVYMGGTYYDGGVGGNDTFVADFNAWEWRFGDRGGLLLDATAPVSYFGDVTIVGMDRLHVIGTSAADVIYGGLLDDFIDGGEGDDFLSGGVDTASDTILAGDGDDRLYWHSAGDDSIDGESGRDTLFVEAFQVEDTGTGSTSPDYVFGGNLVNVFLAADGTELARTHTATTSIQAADAEALFDLLKSGAYASQQMSFGSRGTVDFTGIEAINVVGSIDGSDSIIYQGGNYYDAGEALLGNDRDTFYADFRGQEPGIKFLLDDRYTENDPGKFLANGVYVRGMEAAVIFAGVGNDVLGGGWLGDIFDGGAGQDTLMGFGGNDVLRGGEGSDTFFYDGLGYDEIDGGTNADGSAELDHLIIGGATGNMRVALVDENNDYILSAARQIVRFDSSGIDLLDLAEKSLTAHQWNYYVATPGSNWQDKSLTHVEYINMEAVDIAGTDDHDDLIVYQNGVGYVGGERIGDADTFVADLRAFADDITIDATLPDATGYDIGQGTEISGFERYVLMMGSGDDFFRGGDLDDAVEGGLGDDDLSGGLGDDLLDGGAGDDLFGHTGGNDTIFGGAGTDALSVSDLSAPFTLAFFADDKSRIGRTYDMASGLPSLADFAALYGISDAYAVMTHGTSSVTFSGIEEVIASGSDFDDVLVGGTVQGVMFAGSGDDVLVGRGGNDFMSGGDGSDAYVFGADFGNDIIFGETAGSSRLMFTAHVTADLAFATDGSDLVISAGDDSVRVLNYFVPGGGVRPDFVFETTDGTFTKDFGAAPATAALASASLFSGDGVTVIGTDGDDDYSYDDASPRSDLMRGMGGDDFFEGSEGGDVLDGGVGRDAVSYLRSDAAVTVELTTFTGSGGHAEGDHLVSIEHIDGSLFDDTISGNRFRNNLFGEDGDDTLSGLGGDDRVTGDAGNDSLTGDAGNDLLYGGAGNDTASGGSGIDYIAGGSGDDTLYGGLGDDILDDGPGDDSSAGGDGDDFLIYGGGQDSWDGGNGLDTADFDPFDAAISVDLAARADVITRDEPTLDTGTDRVVVTMAGIENIRGTIHADLLLGDAGANRLEGSLGNDLIMGGAGDDTLVGGGGIDTVDYSREAGGGGVIVSMILEDNPEFGAFATDTFGNRDVLSGFEVVIGTAQDDDITGNTRNNALYGGAGRDDIRGHDGDDTLYGGDGDDSLYGGNGADTVYSGGGDDLVRLSTGDDFIVEGLNTGEDTYYGDQDFDTISYAGVASDLTVDLRPSTGNVTGLNVDADSLRNVENIIGGTGDDSMIGNSGQNWFSYYGGADTYDGREDSDTISFAYFGSAVKVDVGAAAGAQAGTNDAETLTGAPLRDLATFTNIENVIGSAFGDHITGDAGQNNLFGGAGGDTLHGGAGPDMIFGGAGADLFAVGVGDDGADLIDGGAGVDILDYSSQPDRYEISLVDGDGDDIVVDVEWLIGGGNDNAMYGNAVGNILQGGKGDDLYLSGEGDDVMLYEDGYDYFYGEGGSDTMDFSLFGFAVDVDLSDAEHIRTSDTADWNTGTPRDIGLNYNLDTENVVGTAQKDRIAGDDGANMVNAGLGDDLVLLRGGDDMAAYVGGQDSWDGGAGIDIANFSTQTRAVKADLGTGTARAMTGDALLASFIGFEAVVGTLGNDVLTGRDTEDDTLTGLAGDDTLSGRGGNDTILAGAGDDLIDGGAGADRIDGGEGIDTLRYLGSGAGVTVNLFAGTASGGDAGGDEIVGVENVSGTALGDVLTAAKGVSTVMGLAGNDMLADAGAADVLVGGAGDDLYRVTNADSRITETATGGTDRIESEVTIDLTRIGANIERVTLTNGRSVHAVGDDLANTLTGSSGANSLTGAGGDDVLTGNAGNDALFGGTGNDSLFGGKGGDTLDGGAGIDTMAGGAGDDIYHVGAGDAAIVEGTNEGWDTAYSGVDLTLLDTSQIELLISTGSGLSLGGNKYANTITGDAGANWLRGDAGDDVMTGGAGDDTIYGGDGSDTLIFRLDSAEVTVAVGANAMVVTSAEGTDFVLDDVENFHFADRILTYAETALLTPTTRMVVGDDTSEGLLGSDAAEEIHGNGGGDWITPMKGSDSIDGGPGSDMLSFFDMEQRVIVKMAGGTAETGPDMNRFVNIENVTGSVWGDYIEGDAGPNMLRGLGGYDWFVGSGGGDSFEGSNGRDMISYIYAPDRVGVDLEAQKGLFGQAAGDTYSSIERVTGSSFGDLFYGSDGEDEFRGMGGYDWFVGSGGGRDRYDGGSGKDTVSYAFSGEAVVASLSLGYGSAGDAARDLYTSIENLTGSNFDDVLTGDDDRNILRGQYGKDILYGGGGTDYLTGGGSDDVLYGGAGWDVAVFEHDRADYRVFTAGDLTSVTYLPGRGEGTDLVLQVEALSFADGLVYL